MNGLNEIWKSLRASGHYSKSYEEFESKVKDPAYRNKVMNVMRAGGLLSDEMSSVLKEGGLESPKQKAIDKMAEGSSKKKDITTASSLADGSSDSQESFKRLLTERKSQVPISDVTAVDRPKNEYERKKLSNEIAETQRKRTEKSLYEALDLNALKAEEAKKAEEQQAISLEVGKSPEFQNILNVVDSRIIGKKEESVVPDLNKTFGKYGFTFEETGLGDAMIVRSFDGKNSIKIELDVPEDGVRKFQAEKLRNFLSSYGTEKIQLENEDFLRKSHRAQNLRNVGRLNDDGSESTVKMTSFESDGKFYAIPTLFPKDQNNYTNSPKDWVELPFKDAFELAKQRGEVFEFKTDKEAKDFAKGAWKDVNVRDIEADDFYRKRGLDYITEKKRYEKYQELSNLIDFIEGDNEGSKEAIMKSNPELFVKGQLRKDADEYVKGLKKQRDELGEVVNDYGFFTDGKVAKAREDWDVELDRRQSQIATKAAVLNNFSKGLENKLNEESIKLTGVPVNELAKYVDANLFFKDDKKTELIKNYYALKQMQNSAASMYEISKTYYDAKVDKQVRGEYQENLKGFLSANKAALDRGMIGEQLLSFSLPGGKDISNIKDRQEAANEISQLYKDMMSQGESKTMARWRKAHGLAEEFKVFASDPAELLLTFVSTSISQILPYGSKIISSSVAAGASAGAVAGVAGGPFAEVTVPGGALAGAGYGFRGGMAVTNLAAEYTNALMDAVEKKGYNPLDPQSLEKALADQGVWEEGKAVGLSRGIPIAVADYLTGGLAGRVFKPASKVATTATKLGRDVVERVVVDPVGEAIGELGAQSSEIITGTGRKELSWKEIREEGMGGFGQQTINYGFNRMMDLRNQNNIDIAQSLTNISTVASETASDERISTWANNMHQLKKIDADMNQRIQQNIGLRRQAREVLSVGTDKKVEPGVTNRVMELLSAKEELSSTQNRREVYRDKIQQINKEISAIGESKKLLPQEQSVDLSTIIGTQRAGIAQYTIDGRRFTKEQFLKKVDGMTKDQIERTVLAVKNDPETSNLIKKKYAIQEQAAGKVPVQPTTGVGEKVEEGVPQPKLEITPEKSKKELPEGVTITDAVDEDGEPDYEAEDTLRALAKKRGIGITSDREVAQVARDADGNIIGGTFTSYDNADGKYTFDVVVDEAYEGKGIGSNLLDAVKNVPSYIAEMNPDAKVEVDVVNPTMQKMLESRGFEVTKQLGEGRVLMEPKSEQQPTVSVKTPTVAQPKVGQVNAPIELHKMKEFSQVESRAKNVGQKTIIRQAVKALKSLQSIIPNIEIILHDNNESYFNAAGEKSRGEFQYNDAGVRRIHINLAKANTATMAHEAAHAVFLHAFGENPVLMAKFKDKIAKLLLSQKGKQIVKSDRGTFTLHEYLEDFASRYANESIRPEEYLAELSGLIAGIGAKLDQSILQKIAALVNTIVSKATGGKIKVFENIKDTRDVVDFFNSMSNSFKKGEAIAEAPQRLREKFGKVEEEDKDIDSLNNDFNGEMYEQDNLSIIGKLDSELPDTGRKSKSSLVEGEERKELVKRNIIDKKTLVGKTYSVTMSDHTMVGTYHNKKTGVKVDNLMGGVMFPYIKGIYDAGMAWASTGIKQARELIAYSVGQDFTLIYRMARSTGSRGNANFNEIAFAELVAPVTQGKVSEKVFLKQLNDKLNSTFSRKNKETNEVELIKQNEIFANVLSKIGTKTRTKIELRSEGKSTFVNRIEIKSLNDLKNFLDTASFGLRGNFWSTILKNDDAKATLPWYKFLEKYNVQTIKGIVDSIAEVETDEAKDHDIVGVLKIEPQYTENGLIKVFTPYEELVNESKGVFYVDAPKHPSYKYYVPGKPVGILNEFNSVTEYFPIIKKWIEQGRLNSPYKAVETMGKEIAESTKSESKAPSKVTSKAQVAVHDDTGFVPVGFWVDQLRNKTKYLDDVIKNILEARQQLKDGKVTERKVVKSYLITLASMGSGGGYYNAWSNKTGQKVSDIFLEKVKGQDWIRPEGSAAAYLVTDDGERLVDDIVNGVATPEQIKKMFDFVGVGKESQKTAYVVKTMANGGTKSMTDLFNKNKGKDFGELYDGAIKNLTGIAQGKTGFFNQYFGVSERGVVDARQLNAWISGSMKLTPEQVAKKKRVAASKKLGDQLLGYIEQVGIDLGYPKDLAGYIAHHAIWDAIANSVTTHAGEYMVVSKAQLPAELEISDGWYSSIEKKLLETKIEKQSANKWLTGDAIGKGDEATYTGVRQWLESKNPQEQVSKKDIIDWMRENRVEVKEVVKGAKGKMSQEEMDDVYNSINEQLSRTNQPEEIVDFVQEKLNNWYDDPSDSNYKTLYNALGEANLDLDDFIEDAQGKMDDTRYYKLQLPGDKTDYKEVLVTLPGAEAPGILEALPIFDSLDFVKNHYGVGSSAYEQVKQDAVIELSDKLSMDEIKSIFADYESKEKTLFKSTHFDEPNILVHLRMNTRTDADGNKVLFLEEVQSDWGQTGKKEGFSNISQPDYKKLKTEYDDLYDDVNNKPLSDEYKRNLSIVKGQGLVKDADANVWFKPKTDTEMSNKDNIVDIKSLDEKTQDAIKWLDESLKSRRVKQKKLNELKEKLEKSTAFGPPEAPFVTDTKAWTKLGLKTALKEAVAQDVDKIAWTTGEQQADRYDLIDQVDYIDVFTNDDGTYEIQAVKGNETIAKEKSLKPNQLEGLLGKDLAKKIIEDTKTHKHIPGEENLLKTYRGDDLKVGGEGMKGFYDNIVPNSAKSLVKELTGKEGVITQVKLKEGTTQQAIDITPELKDAVERGMPLFSKAQLTEKAAPSFAKIFGVIKDTKKITMSERELLKKQIRDLARGARDAKKAMNETRESIASALRGMVRSGKLSSNQAATVLRKYSRVDLLNPAKVSDFVDYMVNVFADAEYVEKISRAKKLVARAKKNIKSKLGSGVNIVPDMERILSISPEMIPNNVMDVYMSILEVMGSTEAVLSLPEIGEMTTMINNVLDAVDTQHSLAEELALRFDAYEDKVFEDGKLKFEKTLEKMIEEDKITEEDAALMRKYKNQIIEEEREDTVQEEEDNTELISTVKSTDVNESKLPMREDRDKARRLAELAKTNAVNSLNKRDLNALLKIIDNINNGYMPHSAQLMIEKLVSINNSDLITKAIEKSKLAPISSVVARMKKIFSKSKDAVQLMVERNPLYYIDQMLGDYKSKAVFNTIFEKLSEAQAVFNNKSNALTKRLEDVKNNVLKSVGGKMNNLIMSSYKMSTYMRELEYLSNPGSKKVNSAVDYLKATIKHMNTNLKFAEAKMLQDILDNYVVDGKLDIDKLYNSFNSAEKNAIKEFQKINEEMFPMAIHTAGVVRGNRMKPINNYSHIQVLTDYGPSSEASAISAATDYGRRLMPSTKGKSLLERTGKVNPIEFDIFSSVERGARFVMLDYYMTEPIRIVHRTLNRVNKNLEASDKINKKNLKVFNAIKLGVQSAIENVLLNNYIMNSWIDDVSNFITKQGYRAILAGVARSSAEFASNLSMAIKNPIAFAKGVKMYGMIFTPDAVDFANNVGSKQTERLFGSDPLSGKMIESSLISKRAGIRSMEVRNSVVNYIEMLYNKSLKKYKNSVELIADTLISTPDKSVLRPIWFGSFAQKFEDIRGRKFTDSDFKMIASNDERYMSENAYVIDMAKKYADENSVYAGATDNPFMGILKGKSSIEKSVAMKLIDNFNNFMTRFAIFEYTSARTGINAMVGNGTMSKAEGARLLAAVVLRMTMYSILTKEFAELLARPWTDDDDDEEDEKSFNQKVGQAAASTGVSLILGRDFGNFARGLISIGAEDVNEKFLQELRNGEYDPYKDAITYSIVPTDNTLEGYIIRMSGSLGPALKTAQLMLKNSGKRKEAEAIKIQEQNKNLRIPLELAGHAGLVPFYKDIRSIVVNEINKSIEQQEKRTKANKEKSKAEASKNIKKVRDAKNRMRMMNIEITPGVESVLNDYTRYYEEKQSESPDAKFINDFDEMRRERDEMKEKLLDEAKAFSITEIKKINPAAYRKNFGPGSEYYRKYNDLNIVERNMKGVKKKWGED